MKSVVLLDFASEMNRGDAAMQEAIIDITTLVFPRYKQDIVAVYGENQEKDFEKHFDCSISAGAKIIPGVRNSFNPLSARFKELRHKKALNLLAIVIAYLKLLLFIISLGFIYLGNGKRAISAINAADFVIWNGRNFRDRRGIGELYDLFAMVLHPLFCIVLRKKMFAIGVSIWPLQYSASRKLLRFVLSRCVYVTAREEFSLNYGRNTLGLENIIFKPDLSYYYIEKYRVADKEIERDQRKVSLTLVDWKEDGPAVRSGYKSAIIGLIEYLLHRGYKIVVVPQVFYEWEGYVELINEIYYERPDFKGKIEEIKEYLTPQALFEQYRRSGYLVATRMHSAIFALANMCKVTCIPYDAGAKWFILENMGLNSKYFTPYREVSSDNLIANFESLVDDEEYHFRIIDRLPSLVQITPSSISGIKAYIDE